MRGLSSFRVRVRVRVRVTSRMELIMKGTAKCNEALRLEVLTTVLTLTCSTDL